MYEMGGLVTTNCIFCVAVSSLAYEKVCVLFNIAALQSCVAASQSTETDEGRKLAAKLFQVRGLLLLAGT